MWAPHSSGARKHYLGNVYSTLDKSVSGGGEVKPPHLLYLAYLWSLSYILRTNLVSEFSHNIEENIPKLCSITYKHLHLVVQITTKIWGSTTLTQMILCCTLSWTLSYFFRHSPYSPDQGAGGTGQMFHYIFLFSQSLANTRRKSRRSRIRRSRSSTLNILCADFQDPFFLVCKIVIIPSTAVSALMALYILTLQYIIFTTGSCTPCKDCRRAHWYEYMKITLLGVLS